MLRGVLTQWESKILHTLLWGFDFKEGMRGVLFISLGPCPPGEGLKLTVGDGAFGFEIPG